MTHDNYTDPEYVLGQLLAQVEDLTPSQAAGVLLSAALTLLETPRPSALLSSYVHIPGTLSAEYTPATAGQAGTITGYSFTPAGSDAGYPPGRPLAILADGPEIDLSHGSDFWSAVATDLETSPTKYTIPVQWSE